MSTHDPIRLADEEKGDKEEGGLSLRALRTRTIFACDQVSDRMYRRIASALTLMQADDDKSPITIYVNSPGGSADSGFAIYDILRFIKPPVRTVCNGLCASAAVLIYLAAPKERRFCTPYSRFLLHQPSTQLMGAASDIEINANEIIRLRESYNNIVAQETGKTVEQVTRDADRDFWLTASQAIEYGLVGRITKSCAEMEKA